MKSDFFYLTLILILAFAQSTQSKNTIPPLKNFDGAVPLLDLEGQKLKPNQKSKIKPFGKTPLHFEINQGQTDPKVKFLSRGPGHNFFLTPDESVLVLSTPPHHSPELKKEKEVQSAALRMRLRNGNPNPEITGQDPLPGKSNYFIGNDPEKWKRDIKHFAKVRYEEIYPGIDLLYYGKEGQLEYDFVIEPGADPDQIRMSFEGIESYSLESGDLILKTGNGNVVQKAPVIYQEIEGERIQVAGNYSFLDDQEIGFDLGEYNQDHPLIIDPILSYSTFFGGSAYDGITGITVDNDQNIYITGRTESFDFPSQNSIQPPNITENDVYPSGEVFVTKLNPAGDTLIFSTFLGGTSVDQGLGISLDSTENIYLTGLSNSTDFPLVNPLQSSNSGEYDSIIVKLNPKGDTLLYSTYLGGSKSEFGIDLELDSQGTIYIGGWTLSTDFPLQSPIQNSYGGGFRDLFISKIDLINNSLVYSTYLGGNDEENFGSIKVDSFGNLYGVGTTQSQDFPINNPFQATLSGPSDAILFKLNPAGNSLIFSTYFGGSTGDSGIALDLDSAGNIYISGMSSSKDLPVLNAYQSNIAGGTDAFVSKLGPNADSILYSTYLGGSKANFYLQNEAHDWVNDFKIDNLGNAYIAGGTFSTNFPLKFPYQSKAIGMTNIIFFSKLNSDGTNLLYSTHLDKEGSTSAFFMALDRQGNAYLGGSTNNASFLTVNPIQENLTPPAPNVMGSAGHDAILSKFTFPKVINDPDANEVSDLLEFNTTTGEIAIGFLEGSTLQSTQSVMTIDQAAGWEVRATADFNNDKRSDLLLYNTTTGAMRVVLLQGTTILADSVVLTLDTSSGWEPRGTGDFDGDGNADILVYHPATGIMAAAFLDGDTLLSFAGMFSVDVANNWTFHDTGDFNGDGKSDLLIYETASGTTAAILMDGVNVLSFGGLLALDPAEGWVFSDTADFNADLKSDLQIYNTSLGLTGVIFLDGTTVKNFTANYNVDLANNWSLVNAGEHNANGKADLLLMNTNTGDVSIVFQEDGNVISEDPVTTLDLPAGWTLLKGKP